MEKKELVEHLKSTSTSALFARADRVRKEYCGDSVHLRGIIEFSNFCKRDCLYCGLRVSNKKIFRYRMTPDEICQAALKAKDLGYKSIVLQSGEDETYTTDELCGVVKKIKASVDCAITLSVGERKLEDYKKLKTAGADRYLLKFETSNKKLYKKLKPDSSYEERLQGLQWLKDCGFQTGSGSMVGLPGQTPEMIADDILLFEKLDLDMIGIGPFIPHHDTPLAGEKGGTAELALKAVALTRIVTKNAHLPATTALGSIHPQGRQMALQCGANVIMPNLTPTKYRKHYQIYPGKICIDEKPSDCRSCIEAMVASVGRTLDEGYGHALKRS